MPPPTSSSSGTATHGPVIKRLQLRARRRRTFRHLRALLRRSAIAALLTVALPTFGAPVALENRIPYADRRVLQQEALLVIQLLQSYHYASRPFHELEAPDFLDRYLALLDPEHLFLTAEDALFVHRRFDRNLKTVYLFSGDLHPAFEIHDLFAARALTRCDWIDARLQRAIALERPGELALDRTKAAWPANATAADAFWEQWLQAQLAGEVIAGRTPEQGLILLRERNAKFRARVSSTDPLAVREQFLNCLLEWFDPHSGYFSRANADEFNIEMAGAVAGIGLGLNVDDGHFFVQAVYPGGPCDLQGGINPGDEILSVAEANEPPTPLAGLRMREVVRLIRGDADSHVTLSVRPADQTEPHPVVLTRARVDLPSNHASAFLVQVPNGGGTTGIGMIKLPAFYGSQPEKGEAVSMAEEVRELLGKLSEKGAKGIVIDLRDNGGGLMLEATKLAGLFLAGGPLLFTQGPDGHPEILRDDDPAAFTGPLVVLTSPASASASEAFAGAMQCYRRALIVGAGTTFGKGSVQSYLDIQTNLAVSPELKRVGGVARVTRQFYYLPDGRSPQLTGVISDIPVPGYRHPGEKSEAQLPHALPATAIAPPEPLPPPARELALLTPELLHTLQAKFHERQAGLPEFALRQRWHDFFRTCWDDTTVALPLDQRRQQVSRIETQHNTLREERRELGRQLAFPAERVDLAAVATANAAHQQTLRARRDAAGVLCANRYVAGVFYLESEPGGPIRDLPAMALDHELCRAAAPALAAAWTAETGVALDADHVKAILADLEYERANPRRSSGIAALFRRHLENPLAEPVLARGLTAFFRTAFELDDDQLHDLPPLDVSLRESLRLAADWVAAATPSAPAPAPAVAPAASTPPSATPSSVPPAQP